MQQTPERQGMSTRARVALALAAGLIALVLLFPASGIVPIPPQCYSVFGYNVPCDAVWAVAAGALTAGAVGLVLWWWDRRK